MGRILSQDFFARKTETVAQELLGKVLVRKLQGREERHIITETEAYIGPHDLASHASKGRTLRTEVMYGTPGSMYIYFIYGMYYMLNVVTEKEGYPAAVLIRGVEGITGPGRVARGLQITKELNGLPLSEETGLWIEEGVEVKKSGILRTPRIGIDYAGDVWKNKKLRFVLEKN
jgi:DNA-3-methyladenine glycosylase